MRLRQAEMCPPVGLELTEDNRIADEWRDSDPDPSTGYTEVFTLTHTTTSEPIELHHEKWDAGYQLRDPGECTDPESELSLGSLVWHDEDNDGLQHWTEHGISGVWVELWRELGGGSWASTGRMDKTNEAGEYRFDCILHDGRYRVLIYDSGHLAVSSEGSDYPDNDVPFDNNCAYTQYAISRGASADSYPITLIHGAEPSGTQNNENLTLDCGFSCVSKAMDIIIMIDDSGSVNDLIGSGPDPRVRDAFERAATALVESLNMCPDLDPTCSDPIHRVAVISFSGSSAVRNLELSGNRTLAIQRIGEVTALGAAGTFPAHAFNAAISEVEENARPDVPVRVIFLSDGKPSGDVAADRAIDAAAELKSMPSDVAVISVGFGDNVNDSFMRAVASGGAYHYAPDPDNLTQLYSNIVGDLCNPPGLPTSFLECDEDEILYLLDFSTGWAQGTGESQLSQLRLGGMDDQWEVIDEALGTSTPAFVVERQAEWLREISGTQWIARDPAASAPATGAVTTYEVQFNLPLPKPKAGKFEVFIEAMADDIMVAVERNDQVMPGSSPQWPAGSHHGPTQYIYDPDVDKYRWGDGAAGDNTISIDVEELQGSGSRSGLDAKVQMRYCINREVAQIPPFPSNCPRWGDGGKENLTQTAMIEVEGKQYWCAIADWTSFGRGQYVDFFEIPPGWVPAQTHDLNNRMMKGCNCGAYNEWGICDEDILYGVGANNLFYNAPDTPAGRPSWPWGEGKIEILGEDLALDVGAGGFGTQELDGRNWGGQSFEGYQIERWTAWTNVPPPSQQVGQPIVYQKTGPQALHPASSGGAEQVWIRFVPEEISCSTSVACNPEQKCYVSGNWYDVDAPLLGACEGCAPRP